ncbi:hypothetical protein MesoLjLc_22110 [Mesorhizobium sp. L-8-10]|uniref:hypothetical protein n=1 Tax=Mesorhizobium sp. L-8-10 TaxID=2744523 RepID=UPI001925D4CD|nr:hypothetical protein [Mesorhizobium sp. L-8-10]BCH30281.1 hypothetical protein MesoLjLc_22110 [Mesorhizobium sp. L-8-10]
MSGNFVSNACRLISAHLTSTGNTTIFTAVGYVQVIGIRLANVTGSNVVATVNWFNSAANDQFRLLFQHAVPANGQVWLPLEAFALNESDQIRVQAGTANALDVILSISEIPGRSG